jgi:hypothetical protein
LVVRHAAAGDDGVEVIMIAQRLAPGVQHGRDPQLRGQPLASERQQRLAGRVKEELEERGAVLADQAVEGMRQREDQMEIGHGQQRGGLLFEPGHGGRALAVRTMAVAATVGHDVFAAAVRAIERLSAQRAGPARGQRAQRLPLVGRKPQIPGR